MNVNNTIEANEDNDGEETYSFKLRENEEFDVDLNTDDAKKERDEGNFVLLLTFKIIR